jgi:hypothetical protein
MLVYNVTNKVSWAIHEKWVQWRKEKHMPEVMASGCFTDCRLLHLLDTDDEEGTTYAAQYMAANRESYEQYIARFAPSLRKDALDLWGDQFIAFRSLMEEVK